MKHWTIDAITREVLASGDADKWNIPRNVLLVEPLPPKEGFAVVATADLKGTEYIADHRGKSIYNKTNPLESKTVKDLGEIEEGWTLNKPSSQYVTWNEERDDWKTDTQAKYEAQVQQVANTRESLYAQIVDRLNNEAKMIRRVEGDEAKAAEYEAQADAAYLKIRADNPWPIAPEA
ncbi:hypothetical protein [Vibrio fluvialis]|uniref:hypothetical protein n=1 Tax=Vibrio fluvialis TaxID=676 RepID=UPI001C9C2ABB|nr:hypothetical protein [Vibrio fluvialis]MBY8063330.1 hypothetical protein [Vibrio fluvialis]MBY8288634.1 hypothetical protein [Vibrio fluvialis]MCG6389674.1 hypothetical protein [Vibrio fluvialis]MCG6417589.1 hypothetical protein [Vibrio fluvialis]WPK51853.1 hypothetical protein NAF16_09495 [Vibrio fluvialis]